MYVPSHFAENDPEVLHSFIEKNGFALLISPREGEPFATHLPILLHRKEKVLIGHMARANPHWQGAEGQTVLVVFSGPHAYISPSWYEAENVVPTWNYVAVHVYGTFHAIHDPTELTEILRETVATFEESDSDWKFEPESNFTQKLVQQIVGFRINIARIEGKWKLNQNHPLERRQKVVYALHRKGDDDSREIAEMMG